MISHSAFGIFGGMIQLIVKWKVTGMPGTIRQQVTRWGQKSSTQYPGFSYKPEQTKHLLVKYFKPGLAFQLASGVLSFSAESVRSLFLSSRTNKQTTHWEFGLKRRISEENHKSKVLNISLMKQNNMTRAEPCCGLSLLKFVQTFGSGG